MNVYRSLPTLLSFQEEDKVLEHPSSPEPQSSSARLFGVSEVNGSAIAFFCSSSAFSFSASVMRPLFHHQSQSIPNPVLTVPVSADFCRNARHQSIHLIVPCFGHHAYFVHGQESGSFVLGVAPATFPRVSKPDAACPSNMEAVKFAVGFVRPRCRCAA